MSKSLGNFYTIREVLERTDPAALRHYFLGSHYRSPMDFSFEALEEAARGMDRIYETIDRVEQASGEKKDVEAEPGLLDDFRQEMSDDFNTPRALALIFDEVRSVNRLLDERRRDGIFSRAHAIRTMCEALGLLQDSPRRFFENKKKRWFREQGLTQAQVEQWIAERDRARKEKNWEEADRIRNELHHKGIVIEDTPGGTLWKVK